MQVTNVRMSKIDVTNALREYINKEYSIITNNFKILNIQNIGNDVFIDMGIKIDDE